MGDGHGDVRVMVIVRAKTIEYNNGSRNIRM